MEQLGNVLLIGSAGVGKTTLARAVLGRDATISREGVADTMCLLEGEGAPFRIIDAGDIGSSRSARRSAIRTIRRWSRQNALDGSDDNDVHVIWFCVEGKSRKLIRQEIRQLSRATDVWRTVPIIVVITKSYAERERADNVAVVREACSRRKRLSRCLFDIIPVVATPWSLDDVSFVAPTGILELIEATEHAMPVGVTASTRDVAAFEQRRRRSVARRIVGAASGAAAGVGAAPLPIADALILTPIETGMVNALTKLYGIADENSSKALLTTILEAGTIGTAAKAAISALKSIPGVNLAAGVLNAVIAGAIVSTMGEATMRAFEHITRGDKSAEDVVWLREFLESELARNLVGYGTKLLGQVSGQKSSSEQKKELVSALKSLVFSGKANQAALA